MKVRLKKDKLINGEINRAGWVLGVDEPTAYAWITSGDAEAAPDDTRALRYELQAPVAQTCVQDKKIDNK